MACFDNRRYTGRCTVMRVANWRIFLVLMLVCIALAAAIHHWIRLPLWASLGIVIVGLLVNGCIAAVEKHW
jgi:hypothetical protein